MSRTDELEMRFMNDEMNDAPEIKKDKGVTAKVVCAVVAGATVGALGVLAAMELMKKSVSSNDEIAPACNATNGTVSLQYGNGTVVDQMNSLPIMTTVATFTCQQVLCNISAVADTFMGFAWKVCSSVLGNGPFDFPIPNATLDQACAFSQGQLIADAKTGCGIRLVGNVLQEIAVTSENPDGSPQTVAATALQFFA